MFRMTAREFNQSVAKAQRIADAEPVLVTRHGEPAYVLLSTAEYERLTGSVQSLGPARNAWEALRPDRADPLDDDAADAFAQIMDEIVADRARDVGQPPVAW